MNNEPSIPSTGATGAPYESTVFPATRSLLPSLCWKAILGGTVAAIGIHLLLSALGVGAGLATFTPLTDANPAANFSVGVAIVWSLCALVALWFGGVVAGRFSHSVQHGFVHGILVWCLTLIITLLLLSMGTGMVLGGALKVLGTGLGMGAQAVATGVSEVAKAGVQRSGDQLGSFIDEAVQSVPTNALPKASTRAKREIGFAVTRLFAPGNQSGMATNRTAAIQALVEYSQMTEADATKTVDDWTASYKNLQAELDNLKTMAEQKARESADAAASHVSSAALWSFFALLIGLLVTACGGSCGAKSAARNLDARYSTVK